MGLKSACLLNLPSALFKRNFHSARTRHATVLTSPGNSLALAVQKPCRGKAGRLASLSASQIPHRCSSDPFQLDFSIANPTDSEESASSFTVFQYERLASLRVQYSRTLLPLAPLLQVTPLFQYSASCLLIRRGKYFIMHIRPFT